MLALLLEKLSWPLKEKLPGVPGESVLCMQKSKATVGERAEAMKLHLQSRKEQSRPQICQHLNTVSSLLGLGGIVRPVDRGSQPCLVTV